MSKSIAERQKAYEDRCEYRFLDKVPVIIRVDGRNFTKLTNQLPKPFCERMSLAMCYVMLETIKQIDGAVFGYTHTDEITFVIMNNNDADPWFGNKLQKIISNTASLSTYFFLEYMRLSLAPPTISGQVIFECQAFDMPNITETIRNIVSRQQNCYDKAVTFSVTNELLRHYDVRKVFDLLNGKDISSRIEILDTYGINFEETYPNKFKLGIAAYKAPKISDGEKLKWVIDEDLPAFIERKFLLQILTTGSDIFRPDRNFESKFSLIENE